MNLCTPSEPSRMPQMPAAILFPARGLWVTDENATPQFTHTTAAGVVGLPQCQQYETPTRGLAPHLMHATAWSSSWVPQFRQNMIRSVVDPTARLFPKMPGGGEQKILGFDWPAAQAVLVETETTN